MPEKLEHGDTLIVWKLDRLGRSLRDLITMLEVSSSAGFFEMLKARVEDLFHAVHFRAKGLLRGFDSVICVVKAMVDVSKALVEGPGLKGLGSTRL